MQNNFEITQDVLTAAGFEVREDSDQSGPLYVWVRIQDGHVMEGSDMSVDSEEQAWLEVRDIFIQILEDMDINEQQWGEMVGEEKLALATKLGSPRKNTLAL